MKDSIHRGKEFPIMEMSATPMKMSFSTLAFHSQLREWQKLEIIERHSEET